MDARRVAAGLVAAGTLALAPAGVTSERPDAILAGETDEGVRVELAVGDLGRAVAFRIGQTTMRCDEGARLEQGARTYRRFESSFPGLFTIRTRGHGHRLRTRAFIEGEAQTDNRRRRWRGRFHRVTQVFQDGERVDTCRLETHWRAR